MTGEVERTTLPVPVLVVVPVPPLATGSVPVTPVVSESPVAFVNTTEEGVPNAGVTNVGLVLKTTLPVPVLVVTPVPPLATGSVPVTPVVSGSPVAFVNTAEEGVPNAGVANVGLVFKTTLPVPVLVVTPVPALTTFNVPANVTEPCVLEDGVSPVVPALNVVTAFEAIVDVVTKVELAGMVVKLIVPAVVFPDNVGVVIVGD